MSSTLATVILMTLFNGVSEDLSPLLRSNTLGFIEVMERPMEDTNTILHDGHLPALATSNPRDVPHSWSAGAVHVLLVLGVGHHPKVGLPVVQPIPVDVVDLHALGDVKQEAVEATAFVDCVALGPPPSSMLTNTGKVLQVDQSPPGLYVAAIGQDQNGHVASDLHVVREPHDESVERTHTRLVVVPLAEPLATCGFVAPIKGARPPLVAGAQGTQLPPLPLLLSMALTEPLGVGTIFTVLETAFHVHLVAESFRL